jgi:hypothetical protein
MLDERVSSDLKKNLMQARLDKKMTQAQLAQVPSKNEYFRICRIASSLEESYLSPCRITFFLRRKLLVTL